MTLRLIKKQNGRSYTYTEGAPVPRYWYIQDEDGKIYESWEEYQEANKPKVSTKKKTVKKDKDED